MRRFQYFLAFCHIMVYNSHIEIVTECDEMNKLDYKQLQPLSKNISGNKKNRACDNKVCIDELEKYINNFRGHMLNLSVYDMTSLLIAEQDWLLRHTKTTTHVCSLVGKILKIDFGKAYQYENGFIHYSLCIGERNNKYLVIPSTTSTEIIKAAFHPKYRPEGEERIYLLKKEDNVDKDTALFMNDLKYISSGRILEVRNKINTETLGAVISRTMKMCFPAVDNETKEQGNKFNELCEKYKNLEDKCKILQESNNLYKTLVDNLTKNTG